MGIQTKILQQTIQAICYDLTRMNNDNTSASTIVNYMEKKVHEIKRSPEYIRFVTGMRVTERNTQGIDVK